MKCELFFFFWEASGGVFCDILIFYAGWNGLGFVFGNGTAFCLRIVYHIVLCLTDAVSYGLGQRKEI